MGKKFFPWDEIPETDLFPDGFNGIFTVEKIEEQESSTGKLQYITNFRCQEPKMFAGMFHTEWYTVGTDDEPEAIVGGTMGARAMQQLRIAAQVGREIRDADQFVAFLNSTKPPVGLFLIQRIDQNGEPRNRVGKGGYWKVGSRTPGIVENNARQRPAAGKAATPPRPGGMSKATAPPKPTGAPKMNRPPRPGGAASMPAPPPEEDMPPVEAYEEGPPASKKDAFKIRCDNCGDMVAPKEYSRHLADCVAKKKADAVATDPPDEGDEE